MAQAGVQGQPCIAWVEDDPFDRDLIQSILAQSPYVGMARMFPDGPTLLDHLDQNGWVPEAYFLDLKMPRMDGFDVLKALREREAARDAPVVIFSSSRRPAEVQESFELGASEYRQKPVAFDELRAAVLDLVEQWGPRGRPPMPSGGDAR